jgi:hypothetical protein
MKHQAIAIATLALSALGAGLVAAADQPKDMADKPAM